MCKCDLHTLYKVFENEIFDCFTIDQNVELVLPKRRTSTKGKNQCMSSQLILVEELKVEIEATYYNT